MTLNIFIKKLNWRQIILHFIATTFFIFAFYEFAYLLNIDFYNVIKKSSSLDSENFKELMKQKNWTYGKLISKMYYLNLFWVVGLFVSFTISLIINKRQKLYWVNSLIVFILAYVLGKNDLLGWNYLKIIFLKPGNIFKNSELYLLTNGFVLLFIGIFIFYFGKSNEFVKTKNIQSKEPLRAT